MLRGILFFIAVTGSFLAKAQLNDSIVVKSAITEKAWITYRIISQEYIANVNGFILDTKIDTTYIRFKKLEGKSEYSITYHADDKCTKPTKKLDALWFTEFRVRFDEKTGKLAELTNWKFYRDQIVSSLSAQAAAKIISSAEFEEKKNLLNDENLVRKTVLSDLTYFFSLNGDTIRLDAEYMKLKPVRSPMSGNDYMILGSFSSEVPEGARNTILFHAKNKAGELEKPKLVEEVKEYLYKTMPKDQPLPEISGVGLNSEMDWQYNKAQRMMMKVTLSDVLVINNQSRGNIRLFELWDQSAQ